MQTKSVLSMGLSVTFTLLSAVAFGSIGPKKTVCSATINSDDEKLIFQKYLHPDHFEFVELVKNKQDIGFLNRACKNQNLKCDVTLISGHFGGGFTDNKDFFLPLEQIESLACQSCPNVLGGSEVVYLFGCNTLAGKDLDGRTPEEYYRVLVSEVGLEPAEARATVAVRYSAVGESFLDRLRRVFSGSDVIGGFTSKAPLGEQIRPSLAAYFGTLVPNLKQDGILEDWERRAISEAYYNEVERMKSGQSSGSNSQRYQSGQRIQNRFGGIIGNSYVDVPGIKSGTTEDFVAQKMCSMNQSGKNKLKAISEIVNTGDRTAVVQMLPYLLDIAKRGDRMNAEQEAFFSSMSQSPQLKDLISGPTGIINELHQAPEEQLKTVDLAVNLKWMSPSEQSSLYRSAAVHVWNNSSRFVENKKFREKIKAELLLIDMSEIQDSAFNGSAVWNLLKLYKSTHAEWMNWSLTKLPVSIAYLAKTYQKHSEILSKNSDLSEGLKKKHQAKMKEARDSANSICSMLSKQKMISNEAKVVLSGLRSEIELLGAKSCLN